MKGEFEAVIRREDVSWRQKAKVKWVATLSFFIILLMVGGTKMSLIIFVNEEEILREQEIEREVVSFFSTLCSTVCSQTFLGRP